MQASQADGAEIGLTELAAALGELGFEDQYDEEDPSAKWRDLPEHACKYVVEECGGLVGAWHSPRVGYHSDTAGCTIRHPWSSA